MNRPVLSRPIHAVKTQQGAVLIVGLLILLVVTLIGVGSMNNATVEHRITGNLLDSQSAFQAAESALQIGEMWILLQADPAETYGVDASICPAKPCSVYTRDSLLTELGKDSFAQVALDASWSTWSIPYVPADASVDLNNVESLPRYVREYMGSDFVGGLRLGHVYEERDRRYFYRVTAKGTGRSDTAAVVLQSTVSMKYY